MSSEPIILPTYRIKSPAPIQARKGTILKPIRDFYHQLQLKLERRELFSGASYRDGIKGLLEGLESCKKNKRPHFSSISSKITGKDEQKEFIELLKDFAISITQGKYRKGLIGTKAELNKEINTIEENLVSFIEELFMSEELFNFGSATSSKARFPLGVKALAEITQAQISNYGDLLLKKEAERVSDEDFRLRQGDLLEKIEANLEFLKEDDSKTWKLPGPKQNELQTELRAVEKIEKENHIWDRFGAALSMRSYDQEQAAETAANYRKNIEAIWNGRSEPVIAAEEKAEVSVDSFRLENLTKELDYSHSLKSCIDDLRQIVNFVDYPGRMPLKDDVNIEKLIKKVYTWLVDEGEPEGVHAEEELKSRVPIIMNDELNEELVEEFLGLANTFLAQIYSATSYKSFMRGITGSEYSKDKNDASVIKFVEFQSKSLAQVQKEASFADMILQLYRNPALRHVQNEKTKIIREKAQELAELIKSTREDVDLVLHGNRLYIGGSTKSEGSSPYDLYRSMYRNFVSSTIAFMHLRLLKKYLPKAFSEFQSKKKHFANLDPTHHSLNYQAINGKTSPEMLIKNFNDIIVELSTKLVSKAYHQQRSKTENYGQSLFDISVASEKKVDLLKEFRRDLARPKAHRLGYKKVLSRGGHSLQENLVNAFKEKDMPATMSLVSIFFPNEARKLSSKVAGVKKAFANAETLVKNTFPENDNASQEKRAHATENIRSLVRKLKPLTPAAMNDLKRNYVGFPFWDDAIGTAKLVKALDRDAKKVIFENMESFTNGIKALNLPEDHETQRELEEFSLIADMRNCFRSFIDDKSTDSMHRKALKLQSLVKDYFKMEGIDTSIKYSHREKTIDELIEDGFGFEKFEAHHKRFFDLGDDLGATGAASVGSRRVNVSM